MENICLRCPDCGESVTLGHRPAENVVRCPHCGGHIAVPPSGETEDHAAGAYAVDFGQPCPECGKEMPTHGVVCVACGYHRETGKKLTTRVRRQPLNRRWTYGRGLLGCHAVTHLWRDPDGDLCVSNTQYLLYLPCIYREVSLADCREIWLSHRASFGLLGWSLFVITVMLCIAWGILYWWFAYSESKYFIELPRKVGAPINVYEGGSEATMREILDTLLQVGQLTLLRK